MKLGPGLRAGCQLTDGLRAPPVPRASDPVLKISQGKQKAHNPRLRPESRIRAAEDEISSWLACVFSCSKRQRLAKALSAARRRRFRGIVKLGFGPFPPGISQLKLHGTQDINFQASTCRAPGRFPMGRMLPRKHRQPKTFTAITQPVFWRKRRAQPPRLSAPELRSKPQTPNPNFAASFTLQCRILATA